MNLRQIDYMLARTAACCPEFWIWLGNLETRLLENELRPLTIDRPIFLTGLARSGTTILLQLLSDTGAVVTHRYRDFPFLTIPVFWNRFTHLFARSSPPAERPHKDRIFITTDSPEAFEEPLWHLFFPHCHHPKQSHLLDTEQKESAFSAFFRAHIRKLILVRGPAQGGRYLSKGNYNFTRIPWLARQFPLARFIIPIRHPLSHVDSLVRQHQLFSTYARNDPRVATYLRSAGHFEFGPQRVPICLSPEACQPILQAWQEGQDHLGYARQWVEVYRFVATLIDRYNPLADRIHLIKYEEFCSAPEQEFAKLLQFAQLPPLSERSLRLLNDISPSTVSGHHLSQEVRDIIIRETHDVGQLFGY
ncbi:MAG: sulfotransferase [Magnetococcales bacterium]|nr:sulfotransferase [Magnetococcales bacterium]